ncbi:MAG: aminotransferase class I/II-fold pyridoxal phosphate-dependent enzyme [Rhodoferax sp.]|jgi:histidinol-phosphate aminotransferase|uniref:aminotransferase class I/II-fold pyridoxal phosphate-dependent enzyme n=1 Tax=Rhodoferax sp. TaxID=50421 RepID=UPI001B79D23E|nr:aminotransferase class I/II-fold pyridoxal phosphate-dependent enzyme [Rhodoferax sp.]MBP9148045.1 aminotransferase class I/II-fold pyridoxal phosphate-dependent enzyme [Rhodoferax sp.]MBP9735971.1 aminotransferase class I/II-fold pyridoxal phosphate-dependent enzyme [Rhodoferax sp.]
MTMLRIHGGTDALGVPRHDFSTNCNACGPCPAGLRAVQQADARHYPDAAYTDLRAQLAAFHGVPVWRVVLAASASEFIFRITAWVARRAGAAGVHVPPHAYGDYLQAARAWGLPTVAQVADAALVWACEPASPLGQAHTGWPEWLLTGGDSTRQTLVLDLAYAPLRLTGQALLGPAQLDRIWQLFTPNKALGLAGVRAAYAIAPVDAPQAAAALEGLAPSWPVGADGVAMLQAWVRAEVQAWLANSLHTLRNWKAQQIELLHSLGWRVLPGEANFFCARPVAALDVLCLRQTHGIKLRDASAFGLPGWYRLGVLEPQAQQALGMALRGQPVLN